MTAIGGDNGIGLDGRCASCVPFSHYSGDFDTHLIVAAK